MIRLELDELGPPAERRLTAEQGRRLAASGVVGAVIAPHDADLWQIRAAGKVGVAQVGDIEVWIRPKVPIDRLLFLLGYALDSRGWRDEDVTVAAVDDLMPALAHALWWQTERAVRPGCSRGTACTRTPRRCCATACARPTRCAAGTGCWSRWRCATTSSPWTSRRTRSCGRPPSGCSACRAGPACLVGGARPGRGGGQRLPA